MAKLNTCFLHENSGAVTYSGYVRLARQNLLTPISEEDINEFVAQGVNQFFLRFREEAKKQLSTDEINIVLASSQLNSIMFDGKVVLDPIGLKIRHAELAVTQTFLGRETHDKVHEILIDTAEVMHRESVGVLGEMLTRIYPDEKILVPIINRTSSVLYVLGNKNRYFGAVSFPKIQEKEFKGIGYSALLEAVASLFNIDSTSAEKLIDLYSRDKVSPHIRAVISRPVMQWHKQLRQLFLKYLRQGERVLFVTPINFLRQDECIPSVYDVLPSTEILALAIPTEKPVMGLHYLKSPYFLAGILAYFDTLDDQASTLPQFVRSKMQWLTPYNSR